MLLDNGAKADAENAQGETPLHLVSQNECDTDIHRNAIVGIGRLLVRRGVNINILDKNQNTPLHSAAFHRNFYFARKLLDNGANATAENDQGETPLHLVARNGYREDGVRGAQLLLENGMDVDTPNADQNTPLHVASYLGKLEIARVLLDHGAKVGSENNRTQTPLHLVVQGSYWFQEDCLGVAKLLLEHGADMNAQDTDNATSLHMACYRGRLDIARVLLEYDARNQAEND